jgi:hypothetical protein
MDLFFTSEIAAAAFGVGIFIGAYLQRYYHKCASTTHDFDAMPDYGAIITEFDRRETSGEDVSGEVRPRFPGGSDF